MLVLGTRYASGTPFWNGGREGRCDRYHSWMPKDYALELVMAKVTPAQRPWEDGIPVKGGSTSPFRVVRGWSGPAGHYLEQWSIRRGMRELVYEHPAAEIHVRGMQSITEHEDRVDHPITLEPGEYLLVFVVEGLFMGSREILAVAIGDAAA